MRTNSNLKRVLDQTLIEAPSTHFEQRLHQDWQRIIGSQAHPKRSLSQVLTLAKSRRRIAALLAMMAIMTSILLGQHWLNSQEDDLRQIDTLSELSLSTL